MHDPVAYAPDSLYAQARLIAHDALRRAKRIRNDDIYKRSARATQQMRQHDIHSPEQYLALLLLQTPVAVRAQNEMDKNRGGYKNRHARLFELIDFNDTFVDTVLNLPERELANFRPGLWHELQAFCEQVHVKCFDEGQYDAIVHGLSREIAMLRGARRLGYLARMTSRVQDARGVDMIITDPDTKKSIAIDVKTRSAFHFRLLDLQRQNRLDENKRLECELAGFCTVRGGRNDRTPEAVLFRVATDQLGPITHFDFVDLDALAVALRQALQHHGNYLIDIG